MGDSDRTEATNAATHDPDLDAAGWRDQAMAALAESGARAGGARRAVIDDLAGRSCLTSAQELADRLRRQGSSVGVASVYRALDLLGDLGLVQRVEFGDGTARYEPVAPGGGHHHHAVCESCGRVQPFEDAALEKRIHRLAERLGQRPSHHDLILHGTCSECRKRG